GRARARVRGRAVRGALRAASGRHRGRHRSQRAARLGAVPGERRRGGRAQEPRGGAAPALAAARHAGARRAVGAPHHRLAMTPDELAEELAGGRVRPAYLLAGGEPLLRDDALAALRAAVLAGGPADFNLDRLEGDEATPG